MSKKYPSGSVKRKLKADRDNFENKLPKLSNFVPSISTTESVPSIIEERNVDAVYLSECDPLLQKDEDISNRSQANKETNEMIVQVRSPCSNFLENPKKSGMYINKIKK